MLFFYSAFPVVIPYVQRLPVSAMRLCALRLYVFRMPSVMLMVVAYIWLDSSAVDAYWLLRAFPLAALPIFVMGCCCAFATLADYACAQAAHRTQGQVQDAEHDTQRSVR